jgi:hypothetical protein
MTRKFSPLQLAVLLALSLVIGFFVDFCRHLPSWSIIHHVWSPDPGEIVVLALLIFPVLFGVWAVYGWACRKIFRLDFGLSLGCDLLTYIPALIFLLAPLTLRHYLTADDLRARLILLGVGALLAVLYLKAVLVWRWSKTNSRPARERAGLFRSWPLKTKLVLLFLTAVVLYSIGSLTLLGRGIWFSGDEPHYLLITHSLLHDGDFNLQNNYAARDYRTYMPEGGPPLLEHVHRRPEKKASYSFHSPGVSFLMLPFYAVGEPLGRKGLILLLRFGMSLIGAAFGLQLFLFALKEFKREGLALGLWALLSFTSPVFFYSIHIYPEIVAGLMSLWLFRMARHSESFSTGKLLLAGCLFAGFIWFHAIKYPLLLIPLFIYFLWVLVRRHRLRWRLAWFLAGPLVIGSLYLLFQYSLYGSLSFSTVSWQGPMSGAESVSFFKKIFGGIPFRFRWETLAGYFLDQKDGLLLYAPIYFFAFLGLVDMARRKARELVLLLAITGPYVLVQAFLTQRSGYAPQARPIVSVIWALAIPLGYFLAFNAKKIFSALTAVAAALSLAAVVLLLLNPPALYQETTEGSVERAGLFFLEQSNLHFNMGDYLPSYLKIKEAGWLPNILWPALLVLFIVAYILWPKKEFKPKFGLHVVVGAAGAGLFFLWLTFYPRVVLVNPVRMDIPGGEKIGFYNLSRVARPVEPQGRFLLLQSDRSYNFYFTCFRRVDRIPIDFGSDKGIYSLKLSLFDCPVYQGKTIKEFKTVTALSPPAYRLKNVYLYLVSIALRSKSRLSTAENPYLFALRPASPETPSLSPLVFQGGASGDK